MGSDGSEFGLTLVACVRMGRTMGIVPVYHFMLRGDDRVGAPAPYFGIRTVNTSFRIAEDLVIRRV